MRDAGLTVRTDAVGNLIGRLASPAADAPTLMIGSHLDTVPNAGPFDGVLGVMIGLAVAESLIGSDPLPFHVDVVGLSEEEGVRFALPYLGSAALGGRFDPAWLRRVDADKISIRQAIKTFGLDPDNIAGAAVDRSDVVAFIEPHIEQGPVLMRRDCPLGVVTAIAGQSRRIVRFIGDPGHAGTTPMVGRRDALVTAARWIPGVADAAAAVEGLRATTGFINARPNVRNVIPGQVDVSIEVRHAENSVRTRWMDRFCDDAKSIGRDASVEVQTMDHQEQPAAIMDVHLTEQLAESISQTGPPPHRMVSGAGHDAVVLSKPFRTTMMFIRQRDGGISHHPDENVDADDVGHAIDALVHLVKHLGQQNNRSAVCKHSDQS